MAPEAAEACCLLGFVDDPTQHYLRPTFLHRCYARGIGAPVSSAVQAELCLARSHTQCERFLEAARSRPDQPATAALANGASTRAKASPGALAPPPSDARQERVASPRDVSPGPPPQPKRAGTSWLVRRGLRVAAPVALLALVVLAVANQFGRAAPPVLRVYLAPTPVATAVATPAATLPVPGAPAGAGPPLTAGSGASTTQAPAINARQLLDVHFDTRPTAWPDHPPYATWSEGAYRIAAPDPGRFVAVAAPLADVPADVAVHARFQKTGGPAGGGYGIILRNQSKATLDGAEQRGAYYVLEFGDRGDVGAWRRDEDHWIDLVPWTHASIDAPINAVTDIEARAAGDVLTLAVDGSQVLQVEDGSLSASGGVGVFVGGDGNQVALLGLTVTRLD